MVVEMLKKLTVVALVASLVSPVVTASAATSSAKKISISQGKRIYDKAVKATNAWTERNPHTKIVRNEDKSYPGQPVTTTVFTIDRNQNLFLDDSEYEIYILGETLYAENVEGNLADYEVKIVEDLGLDLNAKYAVMHPLILDPNYTLEKLRTEFREDTEFSFTGNRNDAKTTTVTYRKSGSTELLTVTQMFPAIFGSPAAKRVLVTKIERGIITSTIETNTSSDENYKVTTTFKPFNGTIVAPAGPYLEWDKVYLDPRYGKQTDEKIAGSILNSYVREVQALAAFERINTVTIETWKTLAEDENIMLYDKGVEFTYSDDSKKRACGVFTDNGAYLEMKPCEELGFTPYQESDPTDEFRASLYLNTYVREVQALAASNGLDAFTIETWMIFAEFEEGMKVYNEGIEFSYYNDRKIKRACGVFDNGGAYLVLKTCEELGFTKL